MSLVRDSSAIVSLLLLWSQNHTSSSACHFWTLRNGAPCAGSDQGTDPVSVLLLKQEIGMNKAKLISATGSGSVTLFLASWVSDPL